MVELKIPNQVSEIINRLYAHSFDAYIVGKCVRELIVEGSTIDYDIITNAPIEQILRVFDRYSINLERVQYGELIVYVLGMGILISPYKKGYTENGAPIYTDLMLEDLANRDFTFNAIAYNAREGIIDPFGGLSCLKKGEMTVCAIGEPANYENYPIRIISAFERNPVNILVALGYYSTGEFSISEETKEGIMRNAARVSEIPHDEIRVELSWVIRGKRITTVLEEYQNIFTALIPEFFTIEGVQYDRPEHQFDMLTHTNKSVGYASPILTLRYAMLFHALGDPDCRSMDSEGVAHYYGHAVRSSIYARRIMARLGFKKEDIREVCYIIEHQDDEFGPDRRSMKLHLRYTTPDKLIKLLQFKAADIRAQSVEFEGVANGYKRLVDTVNEIVATKECYSIAQLAINKYDLIQSKIAYNDDEANAILEKLLEVVIDAPMYNTRNRLLDIASRTIRK